jgi:hypothetical protein
MAEGAKLSLSLAGKIHEFSTRRPEENLARGRTDRPQDASSRCGLATPALTDKGQCFAVPNMKINSVDRTHVAYDTSKQTVMNRKVFDQIPHFKNVPAITTAHGDRSCCDGG